MKLYHSARSSASYRVRIALACKGIAYESRLLDMQALQHRSPRFLAVNPVGLVPALATGTGILTPADLFHGAGAKQPPLAPINRRHARVETRTSHKDGAQGNLL